MVMMVIHVVRGAAATVRHVRAIDAVGCLHGNGRPLATDYRDALVSAASLPAPNARHLWTMSFGPVAAKSVAGTGAAEALSEEDVWD